AGFASRRSPVRSRHAPLRKRGGNGIGRRGAAYTPLVIRRLVLLALAAGIAGFVASSCGGGATSGVVSPHVIAFSSDRALPPASEADDFDTRRLDLYLMHADGSHLVRLTRNALTDVFPAVSRDESRVAFTRDVKGFAQVFVLDLRDRKVRMLTHAR